MPEACVLERRPLKNSGHDEQHTAEQRTRAHHHRRKQSARVQNPLRHGGQRAEAGPNGEIAQQKNPRRHKRLFLLAAFTVHHCERQDHRRGGEDHHGHHHFGPHEEEREQRADRPRPRVRAGHFHSGTVADAGVIHRTGFIDQVAPGKQRDGCECGNDNRAVPLEDGFHAHEWECRLQPVFACAPRTA